MLVVVGYGLGSDNNGGSEMKYLVYQVGCIECGVSSYPVKVCENLSDAKEVAENHPSTWKTEGGDGFVQIVDLEFCEVVE